MNPSRWARADKAFAAIGLGRLAERKRQFPAQIGTGDTWSGSW
jgi:hypothetical protein